MLVSPETGLMLGSVCCGGLWSELEIMTGFSRVFFASLFLTHQTGLLTYHGTQAV